MTFDSRGFGRRVAAARVWLGLEPKEVAQRLGVSSEAINRWERGGLQRPPPLGQVRLLAEVLKQPETWLLEGDAPPWTTEASTVDGGEDRDLQARRHDQLIQRLDRIDEQLRVLATQRIAEPERRE